MSLESFPQSPVQKCLRGFLHDWRHLEQHARYENVDTDDEAIVTVDYWYCTRCRRIESTERERISTGGDG